MNKWLLIKDNHPEMGQWYTFGIKYHDEWEYIAGKITEIRQVENNIYYSAEDERGDEVCYLCDPDRCYFQKISEPTQPDEQE